MCCSGPACCSCSGAVKSDLPPLKRRWTRANTGSVAAQGGHSVSGARPPASERERERENGEEEEELDSDERAMGERE